jgi:ATP-binding cassette, subfamily C, bacterial CydC
MQPSIATLEVAIVGVRFFGIGRGVFRYLERLASHSVNLGLLAKIRLWIYQKLEPLVPAKILERKSGDLLAILTADVDSLENLFVRVMEPPLTAIFIAIGMAFFLGSYNPAFSYILLVGFFIGGICIPWLVFRLSIKPSEAYISYRAEMYAGMLEVMNGMADITAFGCEEKQKMAISSLSSDFGKSQRTLARVNGFGSSAQVWGTNFCVLAMIWIAIPFVRNGQFDGTFLAVIALMTLASFEAIQPLLQTAQQSKSVTAAGERIFSLTDSTPEIQEPSEPKNLPENYDLEMANVSFRYPEENTETLRGINLKIPAKKRIALVGPSGSGKSTLVNLLVRTWDATNGSIRIGGVDYQHILGQDIWERISLLSQSPVVLTDTLRRNLLVGKSHASEEEMVSAIRHAGLSDWYEGLSQALDSWLGERGTKMSAGERQRLGIARIILKGSPIQIFDEPTANLDAQTEKKILDLILDNAKKKSILWVTHRLIALDQMDEILFMEGGRIVERGTQASLITSGGRFSEYYQIQNAWLEDIQNQDN